MVVGKNGFTLQSVLQKNYVEPSTRRVTHRVAELPSLRYGTIGENKKVLGPLKLKNSCRVDAKRSYTTGASKFEPVRPNRRVRFALPPPDGVHPTIPDASGGSVSFVEGTRRCQRQSNDANVSRACEVVHLRKRSRDLNEYCEWPFGSYKTPSAFQTGHKDLNNDGFPDIQSHSNRVTRKLGDNRTFLDDPIGTKEKKRALKFGTSKKAFDDCGCACVSSRKSTSPERKFSNLRDDFEKYDGDTRDGSVVKDSFRNSFKVLNSLSGSVRQCESITATRSFSSPLPDRTVLEHSGCGKHQRDCQSGPGKFDTERICCCLPAARVLVSVSPAAGKRVHPTGFYIKGTLSPTTNVAAPAVASPGGQALVRAARDGEDDVLRELLRRATMIGIPASDVNAADNSGRTTLSYVASNGPLYLLEQILQLPGLDPNQPDNEGNTPLHFAAQAGQAECLSILLTRCKGIQVDARNNLGFTPLMKAALQGRNKCAKMLLFAGANPTLRDSGRGLRADQWARYCGRYVCADVIERHARQKLLEKTTSYGNWGCEHDVGTRLVLTKTAPQPQQPQQNGLRHKLRKVFRTSSNPSSTSVTSQRLITQLTSAALCASTPVLPSVPKVPPVVKSLIRPLTVPRLQVTLVSNNNDEYVDSNLSLDDDNKEVPENKEENNDKDVKEEKEQPEAVKPARTKKKK